MNIEKINVFGLIGLLLFSECSGMDENPNFQQQDQQVQEVGQEEDQIEEFIGQFRSRADELSAKVAVLTNLVDLMMRSAPEAQRDSAAACAEEALSIVENAMDESLNQVLSVFPDEHLMELLSGLQEQQADEGENQEAHEEEEQRAEFDAQEQQADEGENQEQLEEGAYQEQLAEAVQNEEPHGEGENQLPVVVEGYYYPARRDGSFIENLGLLFYSDANAVVQWQKNENGLIKGYAGKQSNTGRHGNHLTVFVYWPDAPQTLRRVDRREYSSKPVVRVKFQYGEIEFDTGRVVNIEGLIEDYRGNINLGIPCGLMHDLFPRRFVYGN